MKNFFYPLFISLAVEGLFGQNRRGGYLLEGVFDCLFVLAASINAHDFTYLVESEGNRIFHGKSSFCNKGFDGFVDFFVESTGKAELRMGKDFPENIGPLVAVLDRIAVFDGSGVLHSLLG